MRFSGLALALVLPMVLAVSASQSLDNALPRKDSPDVGTNEPKFQGGDTIETCTVIGDLPYYTTGTTAGYVHNYDEVCPYSGSTSPDVVYCWTADFTGFVDIHTCESAYDTKLYVYENEYTPGAYHACNDDNYNCPGPVYRSWIEQMPVTDPSTYYIVVDGYGGDFGDYLFNMYEVEGPVECDPFACPPGAFDENEPDCYDGYVDTTNIGCNGNPGVFQYPPFPTAICGTSGNYDDNTMRDMDWFQFTLTEPMDFEVCVCADFQVRLWILWGCDSRITIATDAGPAGYELCLLETIGPGIYYIVISTDGWLGIPCGSEYWATVTEAGFTAVREASWGAIKAMYR
ncbi:MAG: hypothetical protein V3T20_08315 [Gemmatimonadota bacterium]